MNEIKRELCVELLRISMSLKNIDDIVHIAMSDDEPDVVTAEDMKAWNKKQWHATRFPSGYWETLVDHFSGRRIG